jgi:hypothetical protein
VNLRSFPEVNPEKAGRTVIARPDTGFFQG